MNFLCLGIGAARSSAGYDYNCWLVDDRLLIDAAPQVVPALARAGVSPASLDLLLITHFDADHTFGFPLLVPALAANAAPLPVIGPPGTADFLRELCRMGRSMHKLERVRFIELPPGETAEVGPWHVEALAMNHEKESTGYLVTDSHGKKLGISGDTDWCPALERILGESDIALVEMTFRRDGRGKHLVLERDLARMLEAMGPDTLVFPGHLSTTKERYLDTLGQTIRYLPKELSEQSYRLIFLEDGQEHDPELDGPDFRPEDWQD